MQRSMSVMIMIAALALAACGTTPGDRALSGAGIGAGTGALGGALIGGNPLAGAIVGGAAGAALGGLSDEKHINLGKPWWR